MLWSSAAAFLFNKQKQVNDAHGPYIIEWSVIALRTFCCCVRMVSFRSKTSNRNTTILVWATKWIGNNIYYILLNWHAKLAINGWQLAKMKKEYSWHVPSIKCIGIKQLVSKVANILEKLRNLWKWEIWGNIVKIWYFVNNFLIEARI